MHLNNSKRNILFAFICKKVNEMFLILYLLEYIYITMYPICQNNGKETNLIQKFRKPKFANEHTPNSDVRSHFAFDKFLVRNGKTAGHIFPLQPKCDPRLFTRYRFLSPPAYCEP